MTEPNIGVRIGKRIGDRIGKRVGGAATDPVPVALGAWWWDASDADYIDTDVGVRDWTDRVNGLVITQSTGTAQPAWDGTKFTFSAASSQRLSTSSPVFSSTMLGNKPFVASFLCEATAFAVGQNAAVPRLYMSQTSFSYIDNNVVTFAGSTAKQVLTFGHDGTNAFARRNGSQLATAAKELSALIATPLNIGQAGTTYMEGDLYDVVIADASSWGASLSANLAAIENFLLSRL